MRKKLLHLRSQNRHTLYLPAHNLVSRLEVNMTRVRVGGIRHATTLESMTRIGTNGITTLLLGISATFGSSSDSF